MEAEPSVLEQNFRYMMANIGSKLSQSNRQGLRFVYHLPEPTPEGDTGLQLLYELLTRGLFDRETPEKLQEILGKIERKDLTSYVKEYKKSSAFKDMQKQVKHQQELEKEKLARDQLTSSPERRRRDIMPIALTLATQLAEQATKLRDTIKKAAMETDKNTPKTVATITSLQEKLEKSNEALKTALSTAGVVLGDADENIPKKRKALTVPARLFKKRSQTLEGATSTTKSKEVTLPNQTKPITYKPMRLYSEKHSTLPAANELASSPLEATSLAENPDPILSDEEDFVETRPFVRETGLTRDLEGGMRKWEEKTSQISLNSKEEEDSGYMDCRSWGHRLPPAKEKSQPSSESKERRTYVNLDPLPPDDDHHYEELIKTTKNSQHNYIRYGTKNETAAKHNFT